MTQSFDHTEAQTYFTSGFWKNHVFLGTEREKKKAEVVFLRRGLEVSTVLCLSRSELVQLAGEIHRRQSEYSLMPNSVFTTQLEYGYWSRGGLRAKDKQRATFGTGRFRYKVRLEEEGRYKLCHFDGPA